MPPPAHSGQPIETVMPDRPPLSTNACAAAGGEESDEIQRLIARNLVEVHGSAHLWPQHGFGLLLCLLEQVCVLDYARAVNHAGDLPVPRLDLPEGCLD
jgi:hypothetical protein